MAKGESSYHRATAGATDSKGFSVRLDKVKDSSSMGQRALSVML